MVHLLSETFEAASQFGMRLPELYCGFPRRAGEAPTPYPVACLPQAWASGAVFMLLQACLGVRINARRRHVHIERPILPLGVESLTIRDLPVADAAIDLEFRRTGEQVVAVPTRHIAGNVEVLEHL